MAPTPQAAPAPITLATRRTVLLSMVVVVFCVAAVWATEAALAQITPSDRLAYPLLIAWFAGSALLLWRQPRRLLLAQRLISLGLGLYFVGSVAGLLLGDAEPGLYTLATLGHWLMGAHLVLFITWPPRRALQLSTLLALCIVLPAGWITLRGTPWPNWNELLWPLLLNGFFAQVFVVATLYGAARQLQRLSQLVPTGDDNDSRPLTVDDVLALRVRDLEQARDAAEQASRAKSRFLAVMSHELRTPLHGVLGAAELLQRPDTTPAQRAEWLGMVQRGGAHLLHLIEDMLDLSRIEAGRLELARQPVELRRCFERAVESVQPQAAAKGLRFECRLDASLPGWVLGDGFRLTQVLINLLGNAVKFTERGQVTLGAGHDAVRGLTLEIADTGIGIAHDQQAQVFEAFVQADADSTRRYGGTGLGLAITRQLVTLMGGRIVLDSEPGRGTRVTVTLPLPVVAEPAARTRALAGEQLAGVRLLLVDDDAVNLTIATHLLTGLQAQVVGADSGEAALQALAGQDFDAVLMDWRMPGMDGLEATRRLRAGAAGPAAAALPVIGFTASAFAEDRQACLAAGMDDVLVKPVDGEGLLQALRGQLDRRAAAASSAAT